MEVKLQVDELQFKEILDGELKNLPKEKIQEIIVEGMKTYLTREDVFKRLFIESNSWGYGQYPSSYLKEVINKSIPEDGFADIRDEVINTLKDNYNKILVQAVTELITRGLFNSSSFEESVRETLYRIQTEQANPNY